MFSLNESAACLTKAFSFNESAAQVGCLLRSDEASRRHGNASCGSIGTDGCVRSAAPESLRDGGVVRFLKSGPKSVFEVFSFDDIYLRIVSF